MNKNTRPLKGKKIKNIRIQAINCWRMNFTDGTHKFLWAENNGPLGIGQLWLSNKE